MTRRTTLFYCYLFLIYTFWCTFAFPKRRSILYALI